MRKPSIILQRIPNRRSTHKERESCYRTLKQGADQKIGLIKKFIATYSRQTGWSVFWPFWPFGSSLRLESMDARPLKVTLPRDIKTLYDQQISSDMCPLIKDFCEEIRESRDPQSDFLLSTFLIALLKSVPHLIPLSYFPGILTASDPIAARSKLTKPFTNRSQDKEVCAAYLKIAFLCTLEDATKRDYLRVEQLCSLSLPKHYFTNDSIVQSSDAKTTASFLALLDGMIAPRTPYAAFMPELEAARNDHQLGARSIQCETSSDQEADFKATLRGDAQARARLIAQAQSGDISAHYYLGAVFEYEKDWLKAQGYYVSAAMHEHVLSMYQLGRLYQEDRYTDASLWWRRAIASGYCMPALHCLVEQAHSEPQAALHLGTMFEYGEGFDINITRALDYYRQAHSLGNAEASARLGQLYEVGIPSSVLKNTKRACHYYLEAALRGHIESLAIVARLLNTLEDDTLHSQFADLYWTACQDQSVSLQWYLNSVERNLKPIKAVIEKQPELAAKIAHCYEQGHLVACNQDEAFYYYGLAMSQKHEASCQHVHSQANLGNCEAQYTLACYYQATEKKTALDWYLRAAEQQHTRALSRLKTLCQDHPSCAYWAGQKYQMGSEGIAQNKSAAFQYYALAARSGHAEAKKTLESAAVAGIASAQYALGRHYLGEASIAVHWCARAAEQGHTEADAYLKKTSFSAEVYVALARLYEHGGEGISCNDTKAVMFYHKASALDHIPALLQLGEWYQIDHPHQAKDLSQAFQCYQRAADLGCSQALPVLSRLAQNCKAWKEQLLRSNHNSFFRKKQVSQETLNTSSSSPGSS